VVLDELFDKGSTQLPEVPSVRHNPP
jgi:hypothetical protein